MLKTKEKSSKQRLASAPWICFLGDCLPIAPFLGDYFWVTFSRSESKKNKSDPIGRTSHKDILFKQVGYLFDGSSDTSHRSHSTFKATVEDQQRSYHWTPGPFTGYTNGQELEHPKIERRGGYHATMRSRIAMAFHCSMSCQGFAVIADGAFSSWHWHDVICGYLMVLWRDSSLPG